MTAQSKTPSHPSQIMIIAATKSIHLLIAQAAQKTKITKAGTAIITRTQPIATPISIKMRIYTPPQQRFHLHCLTLQSLKTQDLGTDYTSKIVFLCDSVTYGLKSLSMLVEGRETARVWSGPAGSYYIGKASDTDNLFYIPGTDQLLTLPEAVGRIKPEIILIAAGADSVFSLTPAEFKGMLCLYHKFY